MSSLPTELTGTITNVFYQDLEGFFTAARLLDDFLGMKVRIRGNVLLGVGDRVRLRGRWVSDPRFGMQYDCSDFDYISSPVWKA